MDATKPAEPTTLEHAPDAGKRAWEPPTIEVIDVPAETEATFAGVGSDDGIYS